MIGQLSEFVFTEELYDVDNKTFVVIAEPWSAITDADKSLLQKILQAVGLSIEAVVIVQQPTLEVQSIRSRAAQVIYFGGPISGVAAFEASSIGGIPALTSPPLNQLHSDAVAKQKLWKGLKTLFNC